VLLYGTADLLGIDLDEAFRLKMGANMAKLPSCGRCDGSGKVIVNEGEPDWRNAPCYACNGTGKGPPLKRADGKVLKPEGWQKPSMAEAVR
jgi:predicted HAD superfamily Cof-like phosphohydrolase